LERDRLIVPFAAAFSAAQSPDAAVDFKNVAAAGPMMQAVYILGNESEAGGTLFQPG
jgi:hypothetical protein